MSTPELDFDRPFSVAADGSITFPSDVWAPEVFHDDQEDVLVYATAGTSWTPLTGYTGQYGYNGAVMHASEYIGGALERDILAEPATYVITVVSDIEDDENPAGWAVLRLDGSEVLA